MRTLTLARMGRALLLAAAVIMLPQLASAQVPIEAKSFKLQAAGSTDAVTLTATTVTTPYSLNLPAVAGAAGAFLFYTAGGQLAWTDMTSVNTGFYPIWDGTNVVWADPASSANPNWSRTGNNLALGTYKLGTTGAVDAGFNLVTRDVARISLAGTSDGTVTITAPLIVNADASNVSIAAGTSTGTVTIGNSAATLTTAGTLGHTGAATITGATTVVGATDINASGSAATNINTGAAGTTTIGATGGTITTIGSLGHTGTASFSDAVTLGTAASLITGATASSGASGEVLVSKGNAAAPEWESITEAVGIRKAGVVALAGVSKTAAAISVPGLLDSDAIIITLQTSGGSAVVATVTDRDDTADTFHVTLSGTYTGAVNYMVIAAQ